MDKPKTAIELGKKLTGNFTGAITRVKQYTQEVLGTTDKTEFDKSFEDLIVKCDKTKMWTEKILARIESILQTNSNSRAEDFLLDKMEKKRERQTPFEILSQEFINAGSDLGAKQPYGAALTKIGKTFKNIAEAEKEYVQTVLNHYVQPLREFLEHDFRAITKERRLLETKRLDLDACRNKLKKTKTAETKAQAEQELRIAQGEFDRQVEITKLLMDGINGIHVNHLRCLQYFVEFHSEYYCNCHQYMAELQRELNGSSLPKGSDLEGIKDYTLGGATEYCVKDKVGDWN